MAETHRREPDRLELFRQALDNVKPLVEVKSRRVGGATYQVPVEVRSERRQTLAMRWLIDAARARCEKSMAQRLAPNSWRPSENRGAAVRSAKTRTAWPTPTRRSRITAGKPARSTRTALTDCSTCHAIPPSSDTGTSASRRTSTPARPRRPSASCSIPACRTRSARCTTAPQSWTGWSRSRSAASRSPAAATTCVLEGDGEAVPRAPLQHHRHAGARRLHDRGRAQPARARRRVRRVLRRRAACSRSPRPSGARRTSTACRGSRSSTRWTDRRELPALVEQIETRLAATRCRCSSRSAPRRSSRG